MVGDDAGWSRGLYGPLRALPAVVRELGPDAGSDDGRCGGRGKRSGDPIRHGPARDVEQMGRRNPRRLAEGCGHRHGDAEHDPALVADDRPDPGELVTGSERPERPARARGAMVRRDQRPGLRVRPGRDRARRIPGRFQPLYAELRQRLQDPRSQLRREPAQPPDAEPLGRNPCGEPRRGSGR